MLILCVCVGTVQCVENPRASKQVHTSKVREICVLKRITTTNSYKVSQNERERVCFRFLDLGVLICA